MDHQVTSYDFNLLQSVFTSASEGIIIVNREGQIVLANKSAENLFGYESEELEGETLEVLIPSRYRAHHPQHREGFFQAPKSRKMASGLDLTALRKDGTELPVEISLSSFYSNDEMYTAAFIVDVTLRKQHELNIKENEARLKEYSEKLEQKVKERTQELEFLNLGLQSQVQERKVAEATLVEAQKLYTAIAENFPNGLISVLDMDFRFVFVNGSEFNRRGLDRADLIGKTYLSYVSNPEDVEPFLHEIASGKELSIEVTLADQTYQLHGAPLRDDEDAVFQLLIVEENITAQKKAQDEVQQNLAKEKELNELKSRFVSMASHEFRTPLSTILSSVSLIGKYPDDAREKRQKHILRIKSAIANLTNILNDFLSIGRLEEGKVDPTFETVDLTALIHETREEIEPSLKGGQELVCECKEGIEIWSDPRLLKNVFLNLLSNASKYSDENQQVMVACVDRGSYLDMTIQDFGNGIPKAEQSNIFTRFFRAGNVTNIQGTGLGLYIVKNYLTMLGGEISFKSEEDKGTSFFLKLPKHAKDTSH
ncbi:MAG: PAS domain S-box protein [Cytophagales bacterium]|nr:PAS domain S-box protein [Cytophagales bacterium]